MIDLNYIYNILLDLLSWIILGISIIFTPFLNYLKGYIIGCFIELTISSIFCSGLAILGITIYPDQIPLLCGVLGILGSFFKQSTYTIPVFEEESEEEEF